MIALCAIQENATGTRNRGEGTLLNKNICGTQSKTGVCEDKNKLTENSVWDLADVITGGKFVNVLTREEKYYYLTNAINLFHFQNQ